MPRTLREGARDHARLVKDELDKLRPPPGKMTGRTGSLLPDAARTRLPGPPPRLTGAGK